MRLKRFFLASLTIMILILPLSCINEPLGNINIIGTDGKTYRVVSCVLRNTGNGWEAVDDKGHIPVGVNRVSETSDGITITYDFIATKVVSLVVTPDETFASMGLFCGSTVGRESATIKVYQGPQIQGGYVAYDGANWVLSGAGTEKYTTAYSNGILTINIPSIDTIRDVNPGIVTVSGLNECLRPVVYGTALSKVMIAWVSDVNGTVVTTPATTHKAYFTRFNPLFKCDPTILKSSVGNFWVYGIFEI